jgi:Tfp pilus assembly protein PilO
MANTPPQIQSTDPIRVKAPVNPLFSILFFLLIVMLTWFLVWPKFSEIKVKSGELRELESVKDNFGQLKGNVDRLVSQMQSARQDISLLDEALPIDNRISKVYVIVESFAKASGLNLVNITTDTGDALAVDGAVGEKDGQFKKERKLFISTMTLSLSGGYESFLTFLTFLEDSSRIVDVDSVDIAPGENGELTFRVKLKSYFYSTDNSPQPVK